MLLLFAFAALIMVLTPGPNMIYLVTRSVTQGRKAAMISLLGVACGLLFHITLVSFGLTSILMAIPYAYTTLKTIGVIYLLYMAWQAVKPGGRAVFETAGQLQHDTPLRLFSMGLFTSILNPKIAVFYMSLFPQFIKPEYGPVLLQSLTLGFIQLTISFTVNSLIIFSAAKVTRWFSTNPGWVRTQKWLMGSVFAGLALKMALDKGK
ncbi:Threonine/homoserine/homoserine lactone efflux protein [Chitinophaga eiseniae]|uniref:Threonine/homoserine/homoserine lactone efflux protein n=1 Tax=Chitinophaga eiseniae TaxID=634771 RepID=A0A1T4TN42_9BACT|nr:LysE family translocator [Chitinophaga eiseniae]SKA41738.1 Threonine/homoserine/homoserine lactone efflux protein [Chitinophaga eiseniae]